MSRQPGNWNITKLGAIAEFRNGINFGQENAGKGVKVIGVGDFQDHMYPNYDELGEINPQGVVKEEDILQENDIIFVRSNGNQNLIGRSLFIVEPPGNVTYTGFAIRLRFVTGDVYPLFCAHLFKSPLLRRELARYGSGTNIANLNQQILKNIEIVLPPLPEQRRIAEILSTWDEALALTEQLIAALELRKKGLMQRLLTGEVRFPGFVDSEGVQETKYGDVPADWEYIDIARIADEVSTKNENGRDITVLSCTKYDGLVDSLEYFGRQVFSDDTSGYKVVTRGQFAYATNHLEEGSIGYQDLYDYGLVSPMYTVFETDHSRVDDSFLYMVLKTELYRHIFEVNTSGSVNRRGGLRWNEFKRIRVPLPSLEEQRAIAEVIELANQEIEFAELHRDALKQQKKGLMQRLLTGQVRVSV